MNLRQAAQQALEALEYTGMDVGKFNRVNAACATLRQALAEPEQEAAAHSVVAGALFDFMGWLTSRRERLVLSSVDNAAPAADAIKDFAEMRGLNIDDALVKEWQDNITTPTPRKPLTDEEIDAVYIGCKHGSINEFARAIERHHGIGEQHE